MKEDTDNCGVYLEFIYNYNMEYVDSFDPWVNTVDIFVFDTDERFLFKKHSRREDLVRVKEMLPIISGYRMCGGMRFPRAKRC